MIYDIILSNRLDILRINETWLSTEKCLNTFISEILNMLPDFSVLQFPRIDSKGRGIAFFSRKHLTPMKNHDHPSFKSSELADVLVKYKNLSAGFVTIYRPPPSRRRNKLTAAIFLMNFPDYSNLQLLIQFC